jgi:branched-chain amino acid transport system ATP-binding protein
VLELSGLTVTYGPSTAVSGLELSVAAEDAVALLGPNGAGKTSTLRAVSQLVRYRGTVRFDGEDLRGCAPDEVARRGLIQVPEGRHVFPTLSTHENLQMGQIAAHGRRGPYGVGDVYDLFPPLATLRRRPGFTLSGGEQQMLAIGRALVAAPKFLMLDEPSLGLAPIVTAAVFNALDEIRRRTPMLVVEQNTQQSLRVCRFAHVLVNGTIAMSAPSGELSNRQSLLASFLGQTDVLAQR